MTSVALPAEPPTAPAPPKNPITAEQAKEALLRLIRANRKAFMDDQHPDPEKLARLELKSTGEGRHSLGGFIFDLTKHTYSVAVGGPNAPAVWHFHGTFSERDGIWTASEPSWQHMHRAPAKAK